jgi:hypothetical protein
MMTPMMTLPRKPVLFNRFKQHYKNKKLLNKGITAYGGIHADTHGKVCEVSETQSPHGSSYFRYLDLKQGEKNVLRYNFSSQITESNKPYSQQK